jgi:putative oxidoreductase
LIVLFLLPVTFAMHKFWATNSIAIPYSGETSIPRGATVLIGRVLFAALFVMAGLNHFSKDTITYAAAQGVPLASLMVPFSGVLAILGGLSILLGYRVKLGAFLIVLFLLPVTFAMHKFWATTDPFAAQDQLAHFMKNLSMLGGALFISQMGAGPLSLDGKRSR